jgi:hypothetical protein
MNQHSDEFREALGNLVRAAARFTLAAGTHYRSEQPADWDRLVKLFEAGAVELVVTVNTLPSQRVVLAAVVDGIQRPVLEVTAEQVGPAMLS